MAFLNEAQIVFYKVRNTLLNIYMNFRLQSLMNSRDGPKYLGKDTRLQLPPPEIDEGPSKLVLTITLLTWIREMLGSNISPETDHHD
jgi:hypothetical protein